MMTGNHIRTSETNVIKKIMKAKSNHIKKVLSDNVNKPKKFWSQFKNVFFFFENHSQWQTYQLINVLV